MYLIYTTHTLLLKDHPFMNSPPKEKFRLGSTTVSTVKKGKQNVH